MHSGGNPILDRGQLLSGAILLRLIADWDAWVSRRVDSFYFAGDDERVLHRRQSVDFKLPSLWRTLDPSLLRRLGGVPVPITFVSKWRLPEFSLRDGSGNTVSLLQREESIPLATAMLVALAVHVTGPHRLGLSRSGLDVLPLEIQRQLHAIASGEPSVSLRRCIDFQRTELANPALRPWREKLAGNELFMSLAYELAGGFLMTAVVPESAGDSRQVLKFSYNSYVVPAERDRLPVRIQHGLRWLEYRSRDAIDPVHWRRSSSRCKVSETLGDSAGTGRLALSSSCDGTPDQLRHRAHTIACAIAEVKGRGWARQNIRLRPSGLVTLRGMPAGSYRIRFKDCSGFWVEPKEVHCEIRPGETTRVAVRVRRVTYSKRELLASPKFAALPWRAKRVSRGLAWSSKPLAIRVRIGGGGSYHCEFEAPPGLHITRAKLVSNLDGNEGNETIRKRRQRARYVDTVLENAQRAHLYGPARRAAPATAYVYLNLRPRAETIVRPATYTAVFTVALLAALALIWELGSLDFENLPWALFAILLGGPGALAAYFAQAVPSRVTNAMLYGVRLTALLPVAMSLFAAAAMLHWGSGAGTPLLVISGMALIPFAALKASYHLAEHPWEQRANNYHQGPDFEATHLEPGEADEAPPPSELDCSLEGADLRAAIRDRMLERIGGMTHATRRKLLGQRWFVKWEREVPPALYFDSAEPPAVFIGLRAQAGRGKLREAMDDLVRSLPSPGNR
jgi:hypothetical protein